MTNKNTTEWWTLKTPDGTLEQYFVAPYKENCIALVDAEADTISDGVCEAWEDLEKLGYEIVKLKVEIDG